MKTENPVPESKGVDSSQNNKNDHRVWRRIGFSVGVGVLAFITALILGLLVKNTCESAQTTDNYYWGYSYSETGVCRHLYFFSWESTPALLKPGYVLRDAGYGAAFTILTLALTGSLFIASYIQKMKMRVLVNILISVFVGYFFLVAMLSFGRIGTDLEIWETQCFVLNKEVVDYSLAGCHVRYINVTNAKEILNLRRNTTDFCESHAGTDADLLERELSSMSEEGADYLGVRTLMVKCLCKADVAPEVINHYLEENYLQGFGWSTNKRLNSAEDACGS